MKLYLISQNENIDYDTYDCAVVCAANECEARTIHPNGNINEWEKSFYSTWASCPEKVKVEFIGVANNDIEKGVVCSSFNAG